MRLNLRIALVVGLLSGCVGDDDYDRATLVQEKTDLLMGEVMAVSYSGYRKGQHPDRGSGENPPSPDEVLEDLQILIEHGFNLIRVYDTGEHNRTTLEIIERHNLPVKVVLGLWLDAEISNHEGCPWLHTPIPDHVLERNKVSNAVEIEDGIELARRYSEIIVAVNVGNEALVDWTDHLISLEQVITYVRKVRRAINQPVTVAENYLWWITDGATLAAEIDFLGVHTYPVWEGKSIDEGLDFTVANIEGVHAAIPRKPIVVMEAGWATISSEFPYQANETNQQRYFAELSEWALASNVTVFFFEAFDEPWKGDPNNASGAEKHWGLFRVDRTPKLVMEHE